VEQDVIDRLLPALGRLDGDPKLADHRFLPDVLLELQRPQRVVELLLVVPADAAPTIRSRAMTTVLAMDIITTSRLRMGDPVGNSSRPAATSSDRAWKRDM
jgi:hypothetical protein